jgi:two-component system LytT family response regulator
LKTLIIDDEKQAVSALKADIKRHCGDLEIVGEAYSVKDAIARIKALEPDLIFLDIQLTDGTGFDILDVIDKRKLKVIFTTAYSQFAIKAIKFSALDYLLKPIDAEELIEAVKRAKEYTIPQQVPEQYEVLKQQSDLLQAGEKKIVLKDSKSIYFVKVADIIRCEANGSYTDVYAVDSVKIIISKPLKELESMLEPYGFVRTHHSHLVNLHQAKRVDKADGGTLHFNDGSSVPISQRKWEQVIQLLAGE